MPDIRAHPNPLPGDIFNATSARGVVFSTPGTGFLVSANGGLATPTLFGFPDDFQAFSSQRLFTAVNSNITDVSFFLPGTTTAATTTAFGLIFVDVEVAALTQVEFFDGNDVSIYPRSAMAGGNQGSRLSDYRRAPPTRRHRDFAFSEGLSRAVEGYGRVRTPPTPRRSSCA